MSAAVSAALAALLLGATAPDAPAAPSSGYQTDEQAFEQVFIGSGLGQRGYDENREYAAALYQMPDGRWYATPVLPGDRDRCSIPYHLVPPQAVRIAGAHTHGQPRLPEEPSRTYGADFSGTDRLNAIRAFQASHGLIDGQWLLTSELVVLRMSVAPRYDAATGRIAVTAETKRAGTGAGLRTAGAVIEMQRRSVAIGE